MFDDERKGILDTEALEKARKDGKIIGLVQGSWDQFHIGHQRYIKKSKEKCDYLIVGVDSDEKIRKRKGPNRPLIPQDERYEMIKELGVGPVGKYVQGKSVADDIVIKKADEEKWGLIKQVKPDVLIAIPENYSMDDVEKLVNEVGVGSVAFLGRQAETSTSNKLRNKLIANMSDKIENYEEKFRQSLEETRNRLKEAISFGEPYEQMLKHLEDSTDWVSPVVCAAYVKDKWYFGTNQCDHTISKEDLNERTELFYSTVTHAEINLLKRISNIGSTDTIYVSLFPCDKCMKTLIDKGIKTIYYLDDHLDRNWSKRSHELALAKGIKLINVRGIKEVIAQEKQEELDQEEIDYSNYKYIYPPNTRKQEQLDIMINNEKNNIDPLDPNVLTNEVLFKTDMWTVTKNKFPYEGADKHYLLVPNIPIYNIDEMPKDLLDDLKNIILRLQNEYGLNGGALNIRFGDCALSGASLKRIHAHIIEPLEDEKVKFPIGGKKYLKKGLIIKND